MSKNLKLKACENCEGLTSPSNGEACTPRQALVTIRYRIQHDDSGKWWLVCRPCWDVLSQNNPHYRYGGTWKAK